MNAKSATTAFTYTHMLLSARPNGAPVDAAPSFPDFPLRSNHHRCVFKRSGNIVHRGLRETNA